MRTAYTPRHGCSVCHLRRSPRGRARARSLMCPANVDKLVFFSSLLLFIVCAYGGCGVVVLLLLSGAACAWPLVRLLYSLRIVHCLLFAHMSSVGVSDETLARIMSTAPANCSGIRPPNETLSTARCFDPNSKCMPPMATTTKKTHTHTNTEPCSVHTRGLV